MINQTFSEASTFVSSQVSTFMSQAASHIGQASAHASQAASHALQSLNTTQFRLSQAIPLSNTILLAAAGGALVLSMGAAAASRYLYSAKPALTESCPITQAANGSIINQTQAEKTQLASLPTDLPIPPATPSVRSLIAKYESAIESNEKAKQIPPKNENVTIRRSPEIAAKIDFFEAISAEARARNAS